MVASTRLESMLDAKCLMCGTNLKHKKLIKIKQTFQHNTISAVNESSGLWIAQVWFKKKFLYIHLFRIQAKLKP